MQRLGWDRVKWRRHGAALQAVACPRVNHGRWIIDCPFCPSADRWQGGDRFICSLCGNAAAGGRYVDVQPPPARLRTAIAGALAHRPVEFRNWHPGETVADLVAENVAHGVSA